MATDATSSEQIQETQTSRQRRQAGEGSLTPRNDGRWMARFTVTLPTGERKRQHIVLKDKEEVMRRMREEMASASRGIAVNHDGMTVASWLDYWITEIHPKKVKDSTLAQNRKHVKIISGDIGTVLLKNLSPLHVRQMMDKWDKRGMGRRHVMCCLLRSGRL